MEKEKTNENQYANRRSFIKSTGVMAAGFLVSPQLIQAAKAIPPVMDGAPTVLANNAMGAAVLGGNPVRTKKWPDWPQWNTATDEKLVVDDIRSGIWSRAGRINLEGLRVCINKHRHGPGCQHRCNGANKSIRGNNHFISATNTQLYQCSGNCVGAIYNCQASPGTYYGCPLIFKFFYQACSRPDTTPDIIHH